MDTKNPTEISARQGARQFQSSFHRSVDLPSDSAPWRKHLNLTQDEVAKRMGVSPPAFAQQKPLSKPRKATREKIAAAFGITANQLELSAVKGIEMKICGIEIKGSEAIIAVASSTVRP